MPRSDLRFTFVALIWLALAACEDDAGIGSAAPASTGDAAVSTPEPIASLDAATLTDSADRQSDAAAVPQASPHLVVVVTPLGLYHPAFAMSFPGTDPALGFEAPLPTDRAWSTTLKPFRDLRRSMVVVDGLAVHRMTAKGLRDPIVDMPETVLTGAAGPSGAIRGPSLDWIVAASMPAGLREVLLLGGFDGYQSFSGPGVIARPLRDATTAARFLVMAS